MNRDQLVSLFFIFLLVFVLVQVTRIFSPFAQAIFWSAILAFGFYPLYKQFKKRCRMSPALSAAAMTGLVFLIVVPPVALLIINITGQAIELYQSATSFIRDGYLEKLIDQIRALPVTQKLEANVLQWEPLKQNLTRSILNVSQTAANFAITQAGTITKNLFIISLNVFFMLFLTFVFFKDGEAIYDFVYSIAPLEEKNKRNIFERTNETFSAVIRGQILTSMTQAVVAGLVFWTLGIPASIFFAAATFLATLIPVVGAAGVWLPLTLYLVTLQSYGKAAVLAVFGIFVISIIDNVMKPALIGEKAKLPYFMLFFGILGGLRVYGLMGIFLAPVVLTLFFLLARIFREKYS